MSIGTIDDVYNIKVGFRVLKWLWEHFSEIRGKLLFSEQWVKMGWRKVQAESAHVECNAEFLKNHQNWQKK